MEQLLTIETLGIFHNTLNTLEYETVQLQDELTSPHWIQHDRSLDFLPDTANFAVLNRNSNYASASDVSLQLRKNSFISRICENERQLQSLKDAITNMSNTAENSATIHSERDEKGNVTFYMESNDRSLKSCIGKPECNEYQDGNMSSAIKMPNGRYKNEGQFSYKTEQLPLLDQQNFSFSNSVGNHNETLRTLDMEKIQRERNGFRDQCARLEKQLHHSSQGSNENMSSVDIHSKSESDVIKKLFSANEQLQLTHKEKCERIEHLERQLHSREREFREAMEQMREECDVRERRVRELERELSRGQSVRESLKLEHQEMLNTMKEEKLIMESEHKILKLEMTSVLEARQKLESDLMELSERFSSVQRQQALPESHDYKWETTQLKVTIHQLKTELQQKDEIIVQLKHKCDMAMAEVIMLKDKLESYGFCGSERERSMEKHMEFIHSEKVRVQDTLEKAILSNSRLQHVAERLEADVKNRDSLIAQLELEKKEMMESSSKARHEVDEMQEKIKHLESYVNQVAAMRTSLESCRKDNTKMATALTELLESNGRLQLGITTLQSDADEKQQLITELRETNDTLQEERKADEESFESRLTVAKKEMKTERDKSTKKLNKDLSEMKKLYDTMTSKNGELSRSNSELRTRLSEMEVTLKESKDRNSSLKTQYDRAVVTKKRFEENLSTMKSMRESLEELEKCRDQYMKRNEQQAVSINKLVEQISNLQTDLHSLSAAQNHAQSVMNEKDRELERTKTEQTELLKQYREQCEAHKEIEKKKAEVEKRLEEVCNESSEASKHLEEAQNWFKSRFNNLQTDLSISKERQMELERENELSRKQLERVKQQTEHLSTAAKQVFDASRRTMNQLDDCSMDQKVVEEVKKLYRKLEAEKDNAKLMAPKVQSEESSGRQEASKPTSQHSS